MSKGLFDIPLTTIDGQKTTLAPYQGQVLLIVNVASRCGFTSQYAELESLYQTFKVKGFVVLGFPCNQFLHQEPGNEASIHTFATECYRVTFPLFAKLAVRGRDQSPLYTYLAKHMKKKAWPFVPWNFTKILVDQKGQVLRRYPPTTAIQTIRQEVADLLGE